MNCKLTNPSSCVNNPPTRTPLLHSHPTITNHHLSLTNPSSFYPSSSHSKHQPFSFRTNSLGGYNLNFFDITKVQKYFKHNSSSKTHRFNFISKPPLITNPKTPLSKQNMTSRNFSFSNNKPACTNKQSYIQIINKTKPKTPKHPLNNATTTVKNKHMYTPVYKKVNNQRCCCNNKNKNKKLTSLSDNNINTNDNCVKEYKKYITIAYCDKGKKTRKEKKDNDNDDVVTADVISAKERRKAILNGEDLKKKRNDNGKDGDKKRKNVEIKTKHVNNSNKKKYLSINTNATVTVNTNTNNHNKYISKTPKTKPFALHNNNHVTTNNNINNNEYLHTDILYSFNSITNTLGNQTQTHFKNKYRNLFETYFSSGTITTKCIPTSHI